MGPVEWLWLGLNAFVLALTIWAEREANRDAVAARALNGSIVGVVARGNVVRERIRLVIQLVFLAIGVLASFDERATPLNLTVALLLSVPLLLVANSLNELRDRRIVTRKGKEEVFAERSMRMDRLMAAVAENTALTRQGNEAAAKRSITERDRATAADTNATAHRIEEATEPNGSGSPSQG